MANPDPDDGARRPWLIAVAVMIGIVAAALLIWIVPFSTAIVSGANRNNQRDLAIAASGIEHWSRAIPDVARGAFIRGRVQTIDKSELDYRDGWRLRATQLHPSLGSFRIAYTVNTRAQCNEMKAHTAARDGRLPFVSSYATGSGAQLRVVDSLPFDDLHAVDTLEDAVPVNKDVGDYVADIGGTKAVPIMRTDASEGGQLVVCYAVMIPLEKLLVISESATRFSNFLIVDARRQIVTQIGASPLPIASLDGLVPQSSAMVSTIAASLGQKTVPNPQPQRLGDSLEPVDLRIQGRSYLAYVQPFFPPPSFDACRPGASAADASASLDDSAAATAKDAPGQCFVVGLMPKSVVFRQIASPPLVMLVAIGLALGIAIALLPSLRLLMLGPAEAIGRIELICVVLGIPAAASLATLAIIFSADLTMHRSAARATATHIAQQSAAQAARELGRFVDQADRVANAVQISRTRNSGPLTACEAATDAAPAGSTLPLAVNPRPIICSAQTAVCPKFAGTSGLPVMDSLTIFTARGRQSPGTRVVACRSNAGGRAYVSGRDYFARARSGLAANTDGYVGQGEQYAVAQVLAIQDGINKTAVAFKIQDENGNTDRTSDVAVAAGVLPSLISPVLPPPMGLMVIDTRDPALPVVIHPQPNHSGAERLEIVGDDDRGLRAELRALSISPTAAVPPTLAFLRSYDGADEQFVVARIAGSSFIVAVHYPIGAIDAQAALTASLALRTWAVASVTCGGIWLVWLAMTGDRRWPVLWPQERHRGRYRSLIRIMGGIFGAGMVLVLALGVAGAPGILALLIGLAARLAAALLLHRWRVASEGPDTDRFLAPETQRQYSHMLIALVLCLSVLPMAGFWIDAHNYAATEVRREALGALAGDDGAIDRGTAALNSIRAAYGVPNPDPSTANGDLPALDGVVQRPSAASRHTATPFAFASTLSAWSDFANHDTIVPDCTDAFATTRGKQVNAADVVICGKESIHVPSAWRAGVWPSTLALMVVAMIAAGLVVLLVFIGVRVLRALTGFGIAVDAVDLPQLCLTDLWGVPVASGFATLNRKSLLVNAPFVLLDMLRHGGVPSGSAWSRVIIVNVARAASVRPRVTSDAIILVSGLDLVIADTDRRKAALLLIERLVADLEAMPRGTGARLVILSTTAPLERILDAYERDTTRSIADSTRENLRWARVFEDFAAYYFRPIEVTNGKPVTWTHRVGRPDGLDMRAAIDTVVRELRWVPPHVVNGVLGEEISIEDDARAAACVPIAPPVYHQMYRTPIIDWAKSRRFVGSAAAVSYLRSQMIEYYQRRWSSSTHAERLILHNMAFGRLVNLTTAIAFISLVRRGLVVLDPEPRLMNESFAMFVRQAEKLDTIADWQSELPSGAWVKARLPILLTIGLMGTAAVVFAIWSGQQLTALIPLLAAGAPALVATLSRLLRTN
jgi:hypothetical protein